jgi:hypothetical protein
MSTRKILWCEIRKIWRENILDKMLMNLNAKIGAKEIAGFKSEEQ